MSEERILSIPLLKKYALEIVKGEKVREYRAFNDHWAKRICVIENDVAIGIKSFDKVHFYPYNNKWFLDCEVLNIGYYTVDEKMIEELSKEVELPPIGSPIFIINIGEVLATNLK